MGGLNPLHCPGRLRLTRDDDLAVGSSLLVLAEGMPDLPIEDHRGKVQEDVPWSKKLP